MNRPAIANIVIPLLLGTAARASEAPRTLERVALQAGLEIAALDSRDQAAAIGQEIADDALVALSASNRRTATVALRVAATRQTREERL